MVVPTEELIETETGVNAFTVSVMALLVTEALKTQGNELLKTQVTTSPFCKLELVNRELFVPALIPFTFHW